MDITEDIADGILSEVPTEALHDSIREDLNPDILVGGNDYADEMMYTRQSNMYDRANLLQLMDLTNAALPANAMNALTATPQIKEAMRPAEVREKAYPAEPIVDIDPTVSTGDMMALILAEIERKKIAGHHIDSMNSFYRVGIKQIITKVFVVEGRLRNVRDKTDEDREITNITFKVEFNDINLTPPTTTKYKSSSVQMLTPNMARIKNLTYSAQMYISANISAIATYKNGTIKERKGELRNHRIASMPCMVGTELCNTFNCPKEMLKSLEEDPMDPGGYFIIKGGEWTVDNLENITNNTFHVYKNMHLNEIVRGNFLSKPGDAYENSYQVLIRYLNSGAITVEITTNKSDKLEIPYYLIFRALGMTRDRDIINHIVYGVDNEDPITKHMLEVLERAFEVDDARFGFIRKSTDPIEIVTYIAVKITESVSAAVVKKEENIAKYLNSNILSIIDRYIFPHIGTTIEHRIKKLRFLGHLINKLLRVEMEVIDSTDRDSYKNKRVHAAGTSIAKTFKTDFNFTIAQEVKKQLTKDFKSTPFSNVQLVESVKAAINTEDLERMLIQAITTGNKTITMRRNEIINRVSSQSVYHKNDMNVKSILNTINTPNTSVSKQNERADEMRRVHPTYPGYIDISQSADSGEKVGMTKQMACMASVCGASSSYVLKRILEEDADIIQLDIIQPEQITSLKLTKVFVNGDWVGCCKKSHELVYKYRTKRRYDDIHPYTTIVWEILVREVHFWTDVGRLMRPLVIVYNNLAEYIAGRRAGKPVKFHQWIKLTKAHIRALQAKTLTMEDLRKERVLEYISPEEQENAKLAYNIDILRKFAGTITEQYTHCDIDQAIFGIVSLASPLANHSSAARITLYTNHRKQSAGWFALNWPFRIDKNTTLQHYCEHPLVSCFSDHLTYPNGQNCTVALAIHGGYNMEDSIEANRSSIDAGMFNASCFNNEKTELEKGEQFGNADSARTMDIKKDAVYEYTDAKGFIREGTIAKKGYVLIVKCAKIPKPVDQYLYFDKSIVYKKDEPIFIESVVTPRNDEDALIAKVKWRCERPLGVGDKLCLTPDHEVLTARGWVPIGEVNLDDEVATLYDGCYIIYDRIVAKYSYLHEKSVYTICAPFVNLRTTLNHRMYVSTDSLNYELENAKAICGAPRFYKTTGEWLSPDVRSMRLPESAGRPSIVPMDDWVRFVGLYMFYGHLGRADIVIKCPNYRLLNDICVRLGLHCFNWGHIEDERLYGVLAGYERFPEYIWGLSARQSQLMLNTIILASRPAELCTCYECDVGEQTFVDSDCSLYTRNGLIADDFARLALHAGWSASVFEYKANNYRCRLNKTNLRPLVNAAAAEDRIEAYNGPVYCLEVPSHVFYVRRGGIPVWTGNSSRTGNKGIVSRRVDRCDMLFTEDGMTPDLIVNAHSIPSRMAINQIIECLMAQLAAEKGCILDATSFRKIDIDGMVRELEGFGIKYGGHRRCYNGRTGDWIDTLIFIGPTTYQRLQKFVIDEHYAIRTGPTSALTRLSLEGKLHDGGIKIGEMEKDVLVGHGSMRGLTEKFYADADGMYLPICRICGRIAIVNEKVGIYKCKTCGDSADIANVASSWVANLFHNEASAMNVMMSYELAPYAYDRMQAE